MELLKLLINSSKSVDFCFLCFKKDVNNLDIHTVFEIRNSYEVISVSLKDMLKNLFPIVDFVFMQACIDCSDLLSEIYTLFHTRKHKITLLDYMVQQLLLKTNGICNIPLSNDKLILKLQVPSYQNGNNENFIHTECSEDHHASNIYTSTSNYVSNGEKCKERANIDLNEQVGKVCRYCSAIFLGTYELSTHLKIHRKRRKRQRIYHYCSDCNYKTLSKTTLQGHVNKKHLNTRPHVCQVCYKGFYNSSNLNEHVKTHNSQRNQVCEQCGCCFLHKKSLIEHLRLHSDTRPYKCDVCNKSFITSGRRSDHIKRSHMEKAECCLICNKKYSLKKELTRHMNSVHLGCV